MYFFFVLWVCGDPVDLWGLTQAYCWDRSKQIKIWSFSEAIIKRHTHQTGAIRMANRLNICNRALLQLFFCLLTLIIALICTFYECKTHIRLAKNVLERIAKWSLNTIAKWGEQSTRYVWVPRKDTVTADAAISWTTCPVESSALWHWWPVVPSW